MNMTSMFLEGVINKNKGKENYLLNKSIGGTYSLAKLLEITDKKGKIVIDERDGLFSFKTKDGIFNSDSPKPLPKEEEKFFHEPLEAEIENAEEKAESHHSQYDTEYI